MSVRMTCMLGIAAATMAALASVIVIYAAIALLAGS